MHLFNNEEFDSMLHVCDSQLRSCKKVNYHNHTVPWQLFSQILYRNYWKSQLFNQQPLVYKASDLFTMSPRLLYTFFFLKFCVKYLEILYI